MKRGTAVVAVVVALAAGVGFLPKVVGAQSAPPSPAATTPVNILDARLQGKAALAAAQSKNVLAAVAQKVGRTEADVAQILDSDPSAGIDESGQLFFVEPKAPSVPPSAAAAAPSVSAAPFPYAQTFLLHSRPSATRVIYLDFDGYTSPATSAWGAHVGTPYDTDGVPGTFSNVEQDQIQSTWQRMAEDYAPFDVDVTTQDPGEANIDRSVVQDVNYGTTVAFVNTATPAVCNGCGGVAYLNVFNRVGDHMRFQPAWVIAPGVAGGKNMAEAGSHEVGHNFGLNHDACNATVGNCVGGQGYYGGHGNWGPLMGVGYYHSVSQWSKGEYLGANNAEDDLAIISAGAPRIADEPNVDIATAADMGTLATPQTASGLMAIGGDSDYFKFTVASAGSVKVTATPVAVGPNLDLSLSLLNAAGAVLGVASPVSGEIGSDNATGLDASVSYYVPTAGTYHVKVASDQTDPTGDTGYSLYGSVGRYSLTAEVTLLGDTFKAVPVTRLLDTRNPGFTAIGTGMTTNLTVVGNGVPTNATAVSLNVAAVLPAGTGHLRVFPAGTALPLASTLNFKSKNTPNHAIVKVGAGGQISIYAGISANVIVDINGYFVDDASGSRFTPLIAPAQITNVVLPGATAIPANSTVSIPVLGQGGIPSTGVVSVVLNVSSTNPTASGHFRVYPTGSALPNSSTNNFAVGDSRMNLVVVQPGTGGSIDVYNASAGPVTLTVDTIGYFGASGVRFKSLDPIRAYDSRLPAGTAPIGAGEFREVQIRGFGGVPDSLDITAVVVNVAAVNPQFSGAIDAGPSGSVPALHSLLHPANENVANLMIVPIGADGKIRLVNNADGTTHMIVDIMGFFSN
jgi:Bacterial pre-peptidase C-terminal domain/Metallo-peptidase family M12B Reprolysin-like